MQFSTRLLLCRLGLVLFCIVPTMLVSGWVAVRSWSGLAIAGKAEWERELTARLGLAVRIGEVSYPIANVARLGEVSLLEPESLAVVARAAAIDVTATENGHSVEASQLAVESGQIGLLARAIEQRVLRGLVSGHRPETQNVIHILPRDITLQDSDGYESLKQFGGQLVASASGVKLDLEFQVADAPPESRPVRLSILRDRTSSPPTTHWQLDSTGVMLPCEVLAKVWAPLARLGDRCKFAGVVSVVDAGTNWRGEWNGALQGVDLDALVSEHFPHLLSGLATVEIERGVMHRGTLVELRGTLRSQSGAISPSLIAAAREHLELSGLVDLDQRSPAAVIPYRHLAIGFHLDGQSLKLTGNADPIQPGVLLANSAGSILAAPPQHSVSSVNLLRTLVPENQLQVPATKQTSALVGLLPIPDIIPGPAKRAAAHTPTRLLPAASPQSAVRQPVLR